VLFGIDFEADIFRRRKSRMKKMALLISCICIFLVSCSNIPGASIDESDITVTPSIADISVTSDNAAIAETPDLSVDADYYEN